MRLAYELGKEEEEIEGWPPEKFARWVAYFNLMNKNALDAAKKRIGLKQNGGDSPPRPRPRRSG
jgi:hypothetical protein